MPIKTHVVSEVEVVVAATGGDMVRAVKDARKAWQEQLAVFHIRGIAVWRYGDTWYIRFRFPSQAFARAAHASGICRLLVIGLDEARTAVLRRFDLNLPAGSQESLPEEE